MSDHGTCLGCGADVIWVQMIDSGSRMPIDAEPTGKGIVRFGRRGQRAKVADTYTSHFATCPNAAQHRKGAT